MGWWSSGVLGGDLPWDVCGVIGEMLGSKLDTWHCSDDWDADDRRIARKEIRKFGGCDLMLDSLLDEFKRMGKNDPERPVVTQVAGLTIMHAGVPMTEVFRQKVIAACEAENPEAVGWDKPSERQDVLDALKEAATKYNDKPIQIEQTTLMERIFGIKGGSGHRLWMSKIKTQESLPS